MCYHRVIMTLTSTHDLFFLVAAIAIAWVSAFLCWSLFEIGKMLHQMNTLVRDTRERINRLESAILGIKNAAETALAIGSRLMGGTNKAKKK